MFHISTSVRLLSNQLFSGSNGIKCATPSILAIGITIPASRFVNARRSIPSAPCNAVPPTQVRRVTYASRYTTPFCISFKSVFDMPGTRPFNMPAGAVSDAGYLLTHTQAFLLHPRKPSSKEQLACWETKPLLNFGTGIWRAPYTPIL